MRDGQTREIDCDRFEAIEEDCTITFHYLRCNVEETFSCIREGGRGRDYFMTDCREELMDQDVWNSVRHEDVWNETWDYSIVHDYFQDMHYGCDDEHDFFEGHEDWDLHEFAGWEDYDYESGEMMDYNPIGEFNDTLNQTLNYLCPNGSCIMDLAMAAAPLADMVYFNNTDNRAIVESAMDEADEAFGMDVASLEAVVEQD